MEEINVAVGLEACQPQLTVNEKRNMNTEAQQKAIESTHPRILCISGPGSGKTHTLISRIQRLIESGVPAKKIVAITFTNAAANEMKERLDNLLVPFDGRDNSLGFCGTLHAFMLRVIQLDPIKLGFRPGLSVIDEVTTDLILAQVTAEMAWKGSMTTLAKQVAAGAVCNSENYGAPLTKVELVAAAFFQKLREENLCTFDMVLYYGLKAATDGRLAGLYDFLFCDELQDSTDEDAMIYQMLPIPNKFFVGDPDQSIFGFRGGNVMNINAMGSSAEYETILLETNFRSGQRICDAAQRLIEHNKIRLAKKTHSATPEADDEVILLHSGKLASAEEERRAVLIWIKLQPHNDFEEIAVLCRTNAMAAEFAKSLSDAGLPVRKKAAHDLPLDFNRAKIFLAMLANPNNDRLAFLAIRESKGEAVATKVQRDALNEFKTINQIALKLPAEMTAEDALEKLNEMGVSRESVLTIREMWQQLPAGASLSELIMAIAREQSASKEEGEGITVITYHAAKGREFDIVFLPGFEQGILPRMKSGQLEDVEGDRRLAYVGITRARKAVILSWAGMRKPKWGEPTAMKPSQFLREMGLEP